MKHGWVGALAMMWVLCMPGGSTEMLAAPAFQDRAAAACPVTTPPPLAMTAPSPYPSEAPYQSFWHGSQRFWTMLSGDGTWAQLPRHERGYRQKVFWWYPGFNGRVEARPDLKVFGRRLDGPESFVSAPATNAHHADFGGWTILTGIDVPTTGCWELTGTYRGETVKFVVLVTA